MLVELGGGTNPHPRANAVIDRCHPRGAPLQDATRTPWLLVRANTGVAHDCPAGSVDEVYASHCLEHIPKGQPIINLMNEAWRVLRPGGTFTIVVPLIGFTGPDGRGHLVAGWQPYADPTHVQGWWFPESLLYFCAGPFKPHADYGLRVWEPLGPWVDPETVTDWRDPSPESLWTVRDGWEGCARLVKPT